MTEENDPRILAGIVGATVGTAGGFLTIAGAHTGFLPGPLAGALFGTCFGLLFARRCANPGAGLIWGLGYTFLLWLLIPVGLLPLIAGTMMRDGMLAPWLCCRCLSAIFYTAS